MPATAQQVTVEQVAAVLRRRGIRRLSAEQVLEQLRVPPLFVAPGAAEAASEHALLLVEQLRLLRQQSKTTLQRIVQLLRQMRAARQDPARPTDAEIVDSLPSAGPLTTAALLSEASQALTARNGDALRAYAGVGPVTHRSGKYLHVCMRYACNHRLRDALHHFTMGTLQTDPLSRRHYDRLRASGHSHNRALRGVADRLLSVLIAMLRSGTTYDPTKRKAGGAAAAGEQQL
jgi:transposase